ncbi:transposase family protein [Micromonospora sp. ALFpr18c]|uniref:helix-turn-helix domain-containing protein n=1 Tax=Micromonospora sp. ALFpr18c TaxID=1458665 RepID=UPI001CED0739|nr:transposase family protein [Micromonospora sp. ALFpr18c]
MPRELVQHVARLLRAERRAVGTRPGTRALTCFYQALLVLVWFRKGEDKTTLGAGFGVSRATAYRYVAEAVRVLAAQTPTLHDALARVAVDGWSHVDLATLRNTAISLLRLAGVTSIAPALRKNSRNPHRSLQLLGIT